MLKVLVFAAAVLVLFACAAPPISPRGDVVGRPSMEEGAFVMADGERLPARSWLAADASGLVPPRAVIVGVHGMNDYSNAFDMPASYFAERGISTFAYDQRGFGETRGRGTWPGTDALVEDLDEVVDLVHERYPGTPIYLMGLSMGGAVVLASAGKDQLPEVDGVILCAPAVWGWHAMNVAYKLTLWAGAHTVPGKTLTGSRLEIWPSDNIEMLRAYSRDPLVIKSTKIGIIYGLVDLMDAGYLGAAKLDAPLLVLYGEKDEIVPRGPVVAAVEDVPARKRLVEYANGYHMLERDLQREVVWRDIDAWMSNHDAPLPSIAGAAEATASEVRFGNAVAANRAGPIR